MIELSKFSGRRRDLQDLAQRDWREQSNFSAEKYACHSNYGAERKSANSKGFIALITSIILSVILLTVALAFNQTGFLTRSEVLDSEYKERSLALAEGCADTAILNLAVDPSYTVIAPTTVTVGSDGCTIESVSTAGTPPQTTIQTSAVFPAPSVTSQGAHTNLRVVVNTDDITVVSWDEVP